jgi:uncharacterized protein YndB with AHSA1/START domain
MTKDIIVTRSTLLNTHAARVWEILTHPMLTKQYMFNCEVCSDWQKGSHITWEGVYHDQLVFQKGEIIEIVPGRILTYTTFDPHAGVEDKPENYVLVSYKLVPINGHTELLTTLSNFGGDQVRAEHAASSWDFEVLPKLKAVAEDHVYQIN